MLPVAKNIQVNTKGAVILTEESPETKDSRGIYFPNYIEPVSHIAVDIGGSLAKVVYFTRAPEPPSSPSVAATRGTSSPGSVSSDDSGESLPVSPEVSSHMKSNGALTPLILESHNQTNGFALSPLDNDKLLNSIMRRTSQHFPGGSLNFERFETDNIDHCVEFIQSLIERSARVNGVTVKELRKGVKIVATGGGAHRFYELFSESLGVDVGREDEMECLIEGLKFITLIPNEVYYFSDELIQSVVHPTASSSKSIPCPHANDILERPSPNPPSYAVTFESNPAPQLPCLLVNIGSGVSIIKVDEDGNYERVSGTSLGGGTLWGLLSLLTPATSFDEMLALSEKGDNASVDMLVGDIYGQDYGRLGLKSTTIASSFGKVFKKGGEKVKFSPEDISRSLLYAVSNNIGQIAYMNAEKYGLDRIYFGGYFIRGHAATISTLSYAIRFWSKGTKRALFLRHEGFLGTIGAWIKSVEPHEYDGLTNGVSGSS